MDELIKSTGGSEEEKTVGFKNDGVEKKRTEYERIEGEEGKA